MHSRQALGPRSPGSEAPGGWPTPEGQLTPDGRLTSDGRLTPDGRPTPDRRLTLEGRLTPDGRPTPGGWPTPDGQLTPVAPPQQALLLSEVKDAKCLFMKIKFYKFSPGQGKRLRLGGWRSLATLLHLSSGFLQSALKQPPLSVPQLSEWLAVVLPAVRVGGSRVFVMPQHPV